jgi:hypothetical protein
VYISIRFEMLLTNKASRVSFRGAFYLPKVLDVVVAYLIGIISKNTANYLCSIHFRRECIIDFECPSEIQKNLTIELECYGRPV